MASTISKDLIEECKVKLLNTKSEILNRVKETRKDLHNDERGGDEADQTMRVLAEKEILQMHERLRMQLVEIEQALSRIDSGTYGVCEETEEPIEAERLKSDPLDSLKY